jgi:hypothetical protein
MQIPVPAALSAERALNDSRKRQGFIVRGSPIDTPSPPLPQLDQAPVSCDPIAGDVNARSRTIKHAFTVEQTQQFQITCKVNKTTMHGLYWGSITHCCQLWDIHEMSPMLCSRFTSSSRTLSF